MKNPKKCPVSLLGFFVAEFAAEVAFVLSSQTPPRLKVVSHYVAMAASVTACVIILLMPLRATALPRFDIAAVGQQPSSQFRSPEDNLRLWQFLTVSWMAPMVSTGRKRQLNEDDVWSLGFEFQHQRLHEKFRRLRGSVINRLLQANGIDICIISLFAFVQMFCDFSTPVLLQQLLQTMSDDRTSKSVALTYAFLSLVLRLIAAQSQVLLLWYGRRCYERSRGEMIMMIYEKALSRKNIFGVRMDDQSQVNGDHHHQDSKKQRTCGVLPWGKAKKEDDDEGAAASMGKIFNLLRGDAYEVAQRFWEVDSLIDKPLGLLIAVVLVWKLFGPSCFLGILAVFVGQGLNAIITRTLLRWERVRRAATDVRLQISSQFVEALRHLRWYGWQDHWLKQVMEARQAELKVRIITSLLTIAIQFVNAFASGVFPVLALYAYTLLAGNPLRVDIIFPALQLFTMLETRLREIPALITVLINASIAVERIESFMVEPDKETKPAETSTDSSPFQLDVCTFAWPGKTKSPVLSDVTLTIPNGLTVIAGKVGAGKSALLQALLGELDQLSGISHIPNEMIGYCAQTPWLQSMSIRDNILFSSPYDEARYKRVLDACALLPDLSTFKHGDQSFIGENGIGLSGGQKARVALARAVYSSSRILMLDDPLSALDHNTAEMVVGKCFSGPLMLGRRVVLVTHRVTLVRHLADQIVEIKNGRAAVSGVTSSSSASASSSPSSASSSSDIAKQCEEETWENQDENSEPDKFMEDEHREERGVRAKVYWDYIKAGTYKWWTALVIVLLIYRLISVAQSWFLKEWGEAYGDIALGHTETMGSGLLRNPLDKLPDPVDNVRPWLWMFFGITTFQAVTLILAQLLMLVIVYCAGRTLFGQVMERVSHATFRFFDVTPIGRLMNRLTSDIGVVDGNISAQFQIIAFYGIIWASSIAVIASITPTFLVFSLVLTGAFVVIFLHFLPTSQSLRRLEMVSLSPLISNFGELLHGLTTVRAFQAEERFQERVIGVVDRFQGMDHFYWSLQSWLMYRFESLSGLSTFMLTVLALYTDVSPGLAAFVLISANNFVTSTHGMCKQYGQLQMDFVSVERVDELLHIDLEPSGSVTPAPSWPSPASDIVFDNVTVRYAPNMPPALDAINLRIPGGRTTAIIGRTGSGKSTLAVSLLNATRPETGQIIIDNEPLTTIDTQTLRTRAITFVAQDPVLFPGTIRHNLDPTHEYPDDACAAVLARLCARHASWAWSLDCQIDAGGRNLSQGQRQLIGLARAVLRRSPVVVLDEATASIDHETSLEIQRVLREELVGSTVVVVAHRLEAIRDAEFFVELEAGRVKDQGWV